jgi:hypothetical protein
MMVVPTEQLANALTGRYLLQDALGVANASS